jgi:hypothetical protein
VIRGQITFANESIGAKSFVSDYRVSIIKVSSSASETLLVATSTTTINKTLAWTGTGDYTVIPFWIDCFDAKEITEDERIGIKIEWNINNTSTTTAKLSVWNDPQTEDIKITLPFLL